MENIAPVGSTRWLAAHLDFVPRRFIYSQHNCKHAANVFCEQSPGQIMEAFTRFDCSPNAILLVTNIPFCSIPDASADTLWLNLPV